MNVRARRDETEPVTQVNNPLPQETTQCEKVLIPVFIRSSIPNTVKIRAERRELADAEQEQLPRRKSERGNPLTRC
jgi:hypothetical protein